MRKRSRWLFGCSLACLCPAVFCTPNDRVLNLYSWAEYFPDPLIRRFEAETGIKVNYAVFDSPDVMETTLSAGHSGFDLVTVNASPQLGREIPRGLWQKLDKSRLAGLEHLDPMILHMLAKVDPGNAYAVPWFWGTAGIIFNPDLILARMSAAPTNSVDMVFNKSVVAQFKDCGVTILDSWGDVLPLLAHWKGQLQLSTQKQDLDALGAAYAEIRPYIRRVTTSGYYTQIARGEICLAIGYSGDAMIARRLAAEAGSPIRVEYSFPKEAVPFYVDSFAIPADAPHPEAAHLFIQFALRPENAAEAARLVSFATANLAAALLLDPSIRNNATIYPPASVRARFLMEPVYSLAGARALSRSWLRMKTGH